MRPDDKGLIVYEARGDVARGDGQSGGGGGDVVSGSCDLIGILLQLGTISGFSGSWATRVFGRETGQGMGAAGN